MGRIAAPCTFTRCATQGQGVSHATFDADATLPPLRDREHKTCRTRTMRHTVAAAQLSNARTRLQRHPHAPLLLVGGRGRLRSSAAAFMSCATCRHAYLTNGKANDSVNRQLAALTQQHSSSGSEKSGRARRGRVTLSTLPWSTSAAKASRLHSRSSLDNRTRQHGRVSGADAIVVRIRFLQLTNRASCSTCPFQRA